MFINFETNLNLYFDGYYNIYSLIFYINNKYCNSFNNIYNNDSFKIPSSQMKNYCSDENQFCLIKLSVIFRYYDRTAIALKVTTENKIKNKKKNQIFGKIT